MQTYRILLVVVWVTFGVFLSHFRCTIFARSILRRDRNIVPETNFRKSLSKSRILSPKNNCQFQPSKQQELLIANWSMTSRLLTHWHSVNARPCPIAHKLKTNSHSITMIGRMVFHDTATLCTSFLFWDTLHILKTFWLTSFSLPFSELSLVGLALDVLWHCWLGHLTHKIVFEITCNESSGTLNPAILYHTYWPGKSGNWRGQWKVNEI